MHKSKPLKSVNASGFQKPLFGLLRNISGDLEVGLMRHGERMASPNRGSLYLLLTMAKVAINSYLCKPFTRAAIQFADIEVR